MTAYEVQGRRTVREADGTCRDVVRLATADTPTQAFGIADAMAADDLTAWVFATERRSGTTVYTLVRVVRTTA